MDPRPATKPHRLADALGDVRAEIRALKAREAELRQAVIAARPNAPVTGRRYEVVIRESRRRVFDRDRLPLAILNDDRFWKTSISKSVVTRACDAFGAPADDPNCGPVVGPKGSPSIEPTGAPASESIGSPGFESRRSPGMDPSGPPAAPESRNPILNLWGEDDELVLIEEF